MQTTEKITDQSPVIRLPQSHHRRAKAWAAYQGLTLRQAMCLLIDRVCTSCLDPVQQDTGQLAIPGADVAASGREG